MLLSSLVGKFSYIRLHCLDFVPPQDWYPVALVCLGGKLCLRDQVVGTRMTLNGRHPWWGACSPAHCHRPARRCWYLWSWLLVDGHRCLWVTLTSLERRKRPLIPRYTRLLFVFWVCLYLICGQHHSVWRYSCSRARHQFASRSSADSDWDALPRTSTLPSPFIAAQEISGRTGLLAGWNRSAWSMTLSSWSLRVCCSESPFHDSSWPLPALASCAAPSGGPRSDSLAASSVCVAWVRPALSECWARCSGHGSTSAVAGMPDFASLASARRGWLLTCRAIHHSRSVCGPWADLSAPCIWLRSQSQLQLAARSDPWTLFALGEWERFHASASCSPLCLLGSGS